ncbi:MAG: hypothetical protein V3575_04590 [Candidatus Absconditabacteria bacterium]
MNDIIMKRHSLSHILVQAVLSKYPNAKLSIGTDIENGFYYDFDLGIEEIKETDLKGIEKIMKKKSSNKISSLVNTFCQ